MSRLNDISYPDLFKEVKALIERDDGPPEANISTFPDIAQEALDTILDPGIDIGDWTTFNKSIFGLRPNEFTILCGPSGAGKSTLLSNIYACLMAQGIPTFAAPVEVGQGSFARKVMSIMTGINQNKINEQAKEIRGKKQDAMFFSNELMLVSKYKSRVNHLQLLCDLLHAHRTRGVQVALVDNLNFMLQPSDQESMVMQYDRVIHDFIVFLKSVPMHIFMVMHPRKTDGGRVESEFDIKGSSTAIQEAQNVLLFNRVRDDFQPPAGIAARFCRTIKIAKCRENGRACGTEILFMLDQTSEKYTEIGFLR